MPLFEYKCCKCVLVHELVQKESLEFVDCTCGYTANKIISVPAWRPDKTTQVVVDD